MGKSTTLNILLGNKLDVKKDGIDRIITLVEGQAGPKIGNTIISETSIPMFWKKTNMDIALCDCPGFEDNRSVEDDIANAYYITEAIKRGKKIKILLLIDVNDIGKRATNFSGTIRYTKHDVM